MNNAAKISAISLDNSSAGLVNAKRAGLPETEFCEELGGLSDHFNKSLLGEGVGKVGSRVV